MSLEVSIVMPTYNALNRLKKSLYSYTLQDYPLTDFEVVVIDDGSTDGTEEFLQSHSYPFAIQYEKNPVNSGRSHSLNRGVLASRGKILIFSDGDMIVPPDFISQHAAYHNNNQNLVCCGSFWDQVPLTLTFQEIADRKYAQKCYEKHWSYWFKQFVKEYGKELTHFYFPWMYFVISNVSVRKEHVIAAGGFDENFQGYGAEDEELGYRLFQSGLPFVMDTNLKNYHQDHPRSPAQNSEIGSNVHYILQKHQTINIFFFYRLYEFHHFYKNAVLHELSQIADDPGFPAFNEELSHFIQQNILQKRYIPGPEFKEFCRKRDLPYLQGFIKKLLKIQKRRRFS